MKLLGPEQHSFMTAHLALFNKLDKIDLCTIIMQLGKN